MNSYFTSITTSSAISNLSTRFTSLRRAITSGEENDDPDHEDCSHVSNMLRQYYVEKGRKLPPWLPPDPKSPQPAQVAVATQSSFQGGHSQSSPNLPQHAASGGGGRGGGLGDLWGDPAPSQGPPAQAQTTSLRLGRGGGAPQASSQPSPFRPSASSVPTTPHHGFGQDHLSVSGPAPSQSRPLPSQRAGSYQSSQAAARPGPDRALSGTSAQDRLRARLHGGGGSGSSRTPSPGGSPGPGPGRNAPGAYGASAYGPGSRNPPAGPRGMR